MALERASSPMTISALKLDVSGEDREVEVCGSRRKGSSGVAACVRERRWPTARPRKSSWTRLCMRQDKRHPAHTSLHASHTHTPPARVNDARAQWNCDDKRHRLRHSQSSTPHLSTAATPSKGTHALRLGNARLPHSFSFVSVSRLAVGEHMRVGGAGGPATHEARLQKVIPCALTAPNSHPCHTS
jgi:hypothetical protein